VISDERRSGEGDADLTAVLSEMISHQTGS
jgi:hypothetical protein